MALVDADTVVAVAYTVARPVGIEAVEVSVEADRRDSVVATVPTVARVVIRCVGC